MRDKKFQILKCRLCPWQTPKWIKAKDGKSKSGMVRLTAHVELEHGLQPNKDIIFGEGKE